MKRKTAAEALRWVEKNGIVLQSARGPVPSFAEWVAEERIRGSWWGHPKSNEIFNLMEAVTDSGQILVCKLIGGKVTYVHRRLWPALVRLSERFEPERLAQVESVHTPSGKHELRITPYPRWVPDVVKKEAKKVNVTDAERLLKEAL